jgi:hypothetical protein
MKLYDNKTFMTLQEYQTQEGLPVTKIGKYFSLSEKVFRESTLIYYPLISFLDDLRETLNKPLVLTSLFRTEAKQEALKASGAKAASHSPHLYGCAVDISLKGHNPELVYKTIKMISDKNNRRIRIGYKQYNNVFIHIDFCPEVFGIGGIYEHLPFIPKQFKSEIEW